MSAQVVPLTGIHAEDPETSCLPITSLEALWAYMSKPPKWGFQVKPLAKRGESTKNVPFGEHYCHVDEEQWRRDVERRLREESNRMRHNTARPELLVCHDMMNGYLDDRFVRGSSAFHSYRLYRWSIIDLFVYFSHHFITIPPLGWINTAHQHGVRVLGTFITEWDKGFQICQGILSSAQTMDKTIDSLVQISRYFKLDGWLLNIENKLEDANKMVEFVRLLTERMHMEIPGSRIIWYDSVRLDGKLNWQNELNDNNKLFYSSCDGIFLNYTWTEQHLERSLAACGSDSAHKVFVGVDIFGRNQFGGGGFKTQLAVNVIHKFGFSTALFATGWTHEAICRPTRPAVAGQTSGIVETVANAYRNISEICKTSRIVQAGMNMTAGTSAPSTAITVDQRNIANDRAHLDLFLAREDLFWSLIWRYYWTHELAQLPLSTSFCQGSGQYRNRMAQVVLNGPWFDLNAQEIQPSVPYCPLRYDFDSILNPQKPTSDLSAASSRAPSCIEYDLDDSFNGGSCLRFTKLAEKDKRITRLFLCNFLIERSMIVIVVTKKIFYGCLHLVALGERKDGSFIKLTLSGDRECDPFEEFDLPSEYSPDLSDSNYVIPQLTSLDSIRSSEAYIHPATGDQLRSALIYILKNYPDQYFYFAARNFWMARYYVVPCSGVCLREIAVKLEGPADSTVLLGHLAIIPYN